MRIFVTLLATTWLVAAAPAAAPPRARLPVADHEQAWRLLPRVAPPLPAWARQLIGPLPRTTGAMLELDRLHRAGNPLGAVLAGKLRWAAADALGCVYARRYAEADLRRAGLTEDQLRGLAGSPETLPEADRLALAFARRVTRSASAVSDAEVQTLVERFGAETVVAMVHTVAHANFQGRIFLALGVTVEADGPLPPLDVHLDPTARAALPTPPRPARARGADADVLARPRWDKQTFAELQTALARQQTRRERIPLPSAERLAALPPEARAQAERIVWTRLSMGYQPRLTRAWFDTMRTFQQEARLDRVFSNSLFWVITRTNDCFY